MKIRKRCFLGRTYINTTPHPIVLCYNSEEILVPPSGILINARIEEVPAWEKDGVELVHTRFIPEASSSNSLAELERAFPRGFILGSIIAAQAFPSRVLALVPVPGFERVPIAEKKMRADKFIVF